MTVNSDILIEHERHFFQMLLPLSKLDLNELHLLSVGDILLWTPHLPSLHPTGSTCKKILVLQSDKQESILYLAVYSVKVDSLHATYGETEFLALQGFIFKTWCPPVKIQHT